MEKIENNIPVYVPNDQYDSNHTLITTINSVSDANIFFNTYNHSNGYNGLKLGQKINILGTVKTFPSPYASYSSWYIAGFDCEYNHTASDGTIRNNGYGICLVMSNAMYIEGASVLCKFSSNTQDTPYISSAIHTSILSTAASSLQSTLGSHLVNRNVLLSSSLSDNGTGSTAYTWTTAYATLMSIHQLIGYPPSNICNKYDVGEANYILPLYNYMHYGDNYYDAYTYYSRTICGLNNKNYPLQYYAIPYRQNQSGSNTWIFIDNTSFYSSRAIVPIIYIR